MPEMISQKFLEKYRELANQYRDGQSEQEVAANLQNTERKSNMRRSPGKSQQFGVVEAFVDGSWELYGV